MNTVMTRLVWLTIFCALSLSLLTAAAGLSFFARTGNILNREFMSVREVCQRWGDRPLDVKAFGSAEDDESARAAMACAFLRNQADYVGKHRLEIWLLFGEFTGYYHTEMQPTYLIERAKTTAGDIWQIVFLVDHDQKVTEIFVHKNCC